MAKINPASDLSLRRKEQVFAEGYEIEVATDLTPGIATTDINDEVFGADTPLTERIPTNGTLTMRVLKKTNNNALFDVLMGQNPTGTGVKVYYVEDVGPITVWANKKANDGSKYDRCYLYEDWSPTQGLPTGAPNTRDSAELVGNCKQPIEFEGAHINSEKLSLAGSGPYTATLTKTPTQVPSTTEHPAAGMHALRVVAMSGTGSGLVKESLVVTSGMVGAAGAISIATSDLTNVTAPEKVFVCYLSTQTGIYPTSTNVKEQGLYS